MTVIGIGQNENTLTIMDVEDKENPVMLSRVPYEVCTCMSGPMLARTTARHVAHAQRATCHPDDGGRGGQPQA